MSKKNRGSASYRNDDDGSSDAGSSNNRRSKDAPRRTFLKTSVAVGLAACAAGPALCAGVRAVLAPAFQAPKAGRFHALATVDSLTFEPQRFDIIDDRQDAWMKLTDQKIGTVFLRRDGDRILALHSLCPHAGCMIQVARRTNPETGADATIFQCPCHAARFDLDGNRLDDVAPRNLDALEHKVENGVVYVRFENYVFGIAEKRT